MCLTTMHFAHAILVAMLFASRASPKLSTISSTEGREKAICAGVPLDARQQKKGGRGGGDHKQVKEVEERSALQHETLRRELCHRHYLSIKFAHDPVSSRDGAVPAATA
jgi:hypothetical protein